MSKKILAFAELKDGKFKNSAFEVVSTASRLSKDLACEMVVLTIGEATQTEADTLSVYGATKLISVSLNELNSKSQVPGIKYSPSAFAKVISAVSAKESADTIIFSATSLGKELAGRVAVMTDSAVFNDCTELNVADGKITAVRPVYAGKSIIGVSAETDKIVITIRPNVFKPEITDTGTVELQILNTNDLAISPSDFSSVVVEVVVSSEKLDVAEADRIVSGGRGLKGPEHFHLVEDLANAIGAATGASRAVVDAGWRPHSEQVGQTGKTVSPTLYIACGISGAIQHLAGMSSSKCIVAINKDKDAPIFQVANYGIVGDVFEILPALTDEMKKIVSQ
ncbi:MAG: electron transfer flavoprotein subunit alpha/FixB family protein [Ignavibacteria bacterium]|jgi:electron transfer flavoprotein alpha subunit|nr:electron transfer flavoprotein subunit alpha/FixB family protein [Ignavibacteria bacterium]